jgi:hypothetical protein
MALIKFDDLAPYSVRRYGIYAADWLRPGAQVRISSLSERERAAVERRMLDEQQKNGDGEHVSYRALLIQLTLVDEDGHRIYGDSDLAMIESLDAMVTNRLITVIDQHCQMGAGSEAERIEELEKN